MKVRFYAACLAFISCMIIINACSPKIPAEPEVAAKPKPKPVPPSTLPPVAPPVKTSPAEVPPKNVPAEYAAEDRFFTDIFARYPGVFDSVLANRKDMNVQIIYTEINRDRNNVPSFKSHYFNRGNASYFYPASTVKMPAALLALEKLKKLNRPGLDRNTTFITEKGYSGQTATFNDPTTVDGRPTVAQYIRKIFLVSDNEANNRLYEFLGQEGFNDAMHNKGYTSTDLRHRLAIFLTEDENRHTNPVRFLDADGNEVYSQPLVFNQQPFIKRNDLVGWKHIEKGKLTDGPMQFGLKNRISLQDLHDVLKAVVFPEQTDPKKRFDITEDDRQFVLKYMSMLPSESRSPVYDPKEFSDNYTKFFLYGKAGTERINPNIRIFNKTGWAYGYLTDVAYIVDFQNNTEFMLAATVACNSDGIANNDIDDTEKTGLPFLKSVGKAIYEYDLKRRRTTKPDLSAFRIDYSK